MQTLTTVAAMQAETQRIREKSGRRALVPTMGALHDGHLALVREARKQAAHVTVSIFVNPTQFGPNEDFARYPRTLDADRARLEGEGVDVVFAPTVEEMYPLGAHERVWVEAEGLDAHLCGAFRPGHFRGVTTVVAKLLHACAPHVAVFGMKDAQQFFILRRMVQALHLPVTLVPVAIQREADGLARSSRNVYLTPQERAQATVLHAALEEARQHVAEGEQSPQALVEALLRHIERAPLARVQYAEIVDSDTLQPVARLVPGCEVLVALAAFFGQTRLIDNALLSVPETASA